MIEAGVFGVVLAAVLVWFEVYEFSMQRWFATTPDGKPVVESIEQKTFNGRVRLAYRRLTFR